MFRIGLFKYLILFCFCQSFSFSDPWKELVVFMVSSEDLKKQQEQIFEPVVNTIIGTNRRAFEKLMDNIRDKQRVARLRELYDKREKDLRHQIKMFFESKISLVKIVRKATYKVVKKGYSKKEAQELVRFYKSPLGKKFSSFAIQDQALNNQMVQELSMMHLDELRDQGLRMSREMFRQFGKKWLKGEKE
jgi:hypothetical protein